TSIYSILSYVYCHYSHSRFPALSTVFFSFPSHPPHSALHSFPTRRSSDLGSPPPLSRPCSPSSSWMPSSRSCSWSSTYDRRPQADRKSTRLNSSHQIISYAVFCLKKKNTKQTTNTIEWSRPKTTNIAIYKQ